MSGNDYSAQVLAAYTALTDTPDRPSRRDRALARDLERQAVPLKLVQEAILLTAVRRRFRHPELLPLEPIRSFHYFLPVIRQLQLDPLDPFYVDHIKYKLNAVNLIPPPTENGRPT